MRRFVSQICILALSLASAMATAKDLPNIVFILADDMSYDSVSEFNEEIGGMKTPRIDSLVRQGMYFTDGHTPSSVCTPTRYGLLTGRYCWRTELKKEVLWSYGQPLLEKEQLTIAELLKEKGYQTGIVGKWHLGTGWTDSSGQRANRHVLISDKTWRGDGKQRIADAEKNIDFTRSFEGGPLDHGFDYYFGVDLPNMPPYTWLRNRNVIDIPTVPKPEGMFGTPGLMKEGWQLEDILPGLRDAACKWIAEAAADKQPYFLYVPLTSPHTPIVPSKPFKGKTGITPYVDFVVETDDVVGRIVDAIDDTGEAGNTLVIFSTDNGTAAAASFKKLEEKGINLHNHFRGHKGHIYEGGHRVPLIMRWPDRIKPGTHCDETVVLTDFLATFAEMSGHKLAAHEGVDSHSIWPLITGDAKTLPDHPHVVSHSYKGQYSIRDGHWKLIFPLTNDDKPVLYNLESDVKETTDVANAHPERVATMTALLKKYIEEGRSTPGPPQENYSGQTRWHGLPW